MAEEFMDNTPFKKFADYYKYCKTCAHKDVEATEDPCDECLRTPAQEFTHRPINYKSKEV